jgi:4a-hydroxytetrahydrobiopterin dehydratase
MSATDLNQKTCVPCKGGIAPLAIKDARAMMQSLHTDWQLDATNGTLTRRLEFKGFAKAVYAANLAAYLGDAEGHHPDIAFGWGYCQVVFTTHDAHGLTENDFICAAKFDAMLAAA